jgi:hypothetical protein
VSIDQELDTWRREWREQAAPLPDLKKKIKRQNLRMVAAGVLLGLCVSFTTCEAVRTRAAFASGMAAGLWFTTLVAGGYAGWVRRGAWKPTAQTTLAYAELAHRRAVARARTIRFCFHLLLAATALFALFTAWNWKRFGPRDGMMLAVLGLELFYFVYLGRRKEREIEETQRLVDQVRE